MSNIVMCIKTQPNQTKQVMGLRSPSFEMEDSFCSFGPLQFHQLHCGFLTRQVQFPKLLIILEVHYVVSSYIVILEV